MLATDRPKGAARQRTAPLLVLMVLNGVLNHELIQKLRLDQNDRWNGDQASDLSERNHSHKGNAHGLTSK